MGGGAGHLKSPHRRRRGRKFAAVWSYLPASVVSCQRRAAFLNAPRIHAESAAGRSPLPASPIRVRCRFRIRRAISIRARSPVLARRGIQLQARSALGVSEAWGGYVGMTRGRSGGGRFPSDVACGAVAGEAPGAFESAKLGLSIKRMRLSIKNAHRQSGAYHVRRRCGEKFRRKKRSRNGRMGHLRMGSIPTHRLPG